MKLTSLTAILITIASTNVANAAIVTNTFDNGTDLSSWETDRCAPDSFEVSNNELVLSVEDDSACLDQGAFYHTQGMKLDIGQSTMLSIDMFVDGSWTDALRFGGLWGVSYDSSDSIDGYPILEFQVPDLTVASNGNFEAWDNSGWTSTAQNVVNVNDWNTLMFSLSGTTTEYYINGNLVHSYDNGDTQYFGEVILNAFNDGAGYSVRYDNLVYGTAEVNAPATIGLMMAALGGIALRRRKKV